MAYSSQVWQHMQAILSLCEAGTCDGSALALFRPLAETILRAQWLTAFADEMVFEQFKADAGFRFPGFKGIATDLAKKHDLGDFFDNLKGAYSTLCDYTHGGYEQIIQHVSESTIGPAYTQETIASLVLETEKIGLFHGRFVCRAIGHVTGAMALSEIARTFKVD